ncbi:MAG TPA: DUF72 domain-containing protein [Fimbriimonadales bacterium]|nr:DUF72 domain-containing protein [Fimbriimonadales bacterium]
MRKKKVRAFVGTSGWQYDHWKDILYKGVPKSKWLSHYAKIFPAVEVNASFYHLLKKETYERWAEETPDEFRFCIKGNRFLTHNKKLEAPEESIELEKSRASGLGKKLAVVLWQMPRSLRKDIEKLIRFAEALKAWKSTRHALEFRRKEWFDDETANCLKRYGLANVISDAKDWPMWEAVTTDLVYIRLHGHEQTYVSSYSDKELRNWAKKIDVWLEEGKEVYVFFDNDAAGAAPPNALKLMKLLGISNSVSLLGK